jgi:uncharacterized circularly permuted ATP-grasp superfamily protein
MQPLEYESMEGLLDDVRAEDGSIKPQWSYLLSTLRDIGPEVMREREQKARRILRDDGATYNIYGDDGSPSSSWELDPVPNVRGRDDWANIEAGLLERSA